MKIQRVTPLLIVERIEAVLPQWEKGLGYSRLAEVPHGKALGFVLLSRGEDQLMLQSRASISEDLGQAVRASDQGLLYIDVDSFDGIEASLPGAAHVLPLRTTFYGAREMGFRDAAGQLLIFAIPPSGH